MASANDYAAWIVANQDKRGTPDFETVAAAYKAAKSSAPSFNQDAERQQLMQGIVSDMSPMERGLAGAGKALTDIGRGVGQAVGLVDRADVAESRARDAPLMGTTAAKVGNVAGNLAAFAPAALIPGANTLVGGAALGAGMGFMQPSTGTGETLMNTGLGGAAGAVVPAIMRGWSGLKAAAEPFSEAGQNAIVGRALNRAAGVDAPAVAQRLTEASAPFVGPQRGVPRTVMGEYVPGSIPTVGQAAENAGVSSLERAAVATNPDVTNAVDASRRAQNAARVGSLTELAGQGGARDMAVAARDATAQQLYDQARQIGIDPSRLTPAVLQNIAQFAQRVPAGVTAQARELAQIRGMPLNDTTSVQGMHWMKMAVDDAIDAARRSGNNKMSAALTDLQHDLVRGLGNLSPEYDAARQVYQQMSRPVNQFDVAQAIADRSINRLSGNLQPNAYANALTDQTARRATGFQGATLENTMEQEQNNALQNILLDIRRSSTAENAGKGTGSDTVRKLAYTNLLDQAGVPSFLRGPLDMAGSAFGDLKNLIGLTAQPMYVRTNQEIGNRLAQVMLDPRQAAELMKRATPAQRSQIVNLLQQASSGAAMSAPAIANTQRQ
jgi:hypothetical protein